jgi:hypothetical protein
MACEKVPHDMTRDEAMQDQTFLLSFEDARQVLRDSSVAFIEIPNPIELYLFEVYCAMELNVSERNRSVAPQSASAVLAKLRKHQFVEQRVVRDAVVAAVGVDSNCASMRALDSCHVLAIDKDAVREQCAEEVLVPDA